MALHKGEGPCPHEPEVLPVGTDGNLETKVISSGDSYVVADHLDIKNRGLAETSLAQ